MKAQRAGHGATLREDRMEGRAKTTVLGGMGLKGEWLVCGTNQTLGVCLISPYSIASSIPRQSLVREIAWELVPFLFQNRPNVIGDGEGKIIGPVRMTVLRISLNELAFVKRSCMTAVHLCCEALLGACKQIAENG